jgi:FPC/CPF motif-containing protein YcgG
MKRKLQRAAAAQKSDQPSSVSTKKSFRIRAETAFKNLIMHSGFPCIGAKAACNSGAVTFAVYDQLGSQASTKSLSRDFFRFTRDIAANRGNEYATMITVFRGPLDLSETHFEKLLWLQLGKLHQEDVAHVERDPRVSSDPSAPNFSFSFAGQAYYVIGMHANSSRHARRFRWPTLVFNPHEQFERLRADGNWKRMKTTIRARDFQLQGSINPMLSDFGEESEARQYSGRAVEADWRPPFSPASTQRRDSSEEKCPFEH